MLDRRQHLLVCELVAGELVGHDDPRHILPPLEQFAEELYGGLGVSAGLDEDVEHVALLVDGAPEIVLLAVDANVHLVEVPFIAGSRSAAAQPGDVGVPEFVAPLPDGLVGDDNAALQHQLLDLAEAEREAVVQPDAMADDLRWVPNPLYDTSALVTTRILPALTTPARVDSAVSVRGVRGRWGGGRHRQRANLAKATDMATTDSALSGIRGGGMTWTVNSSPDWSTPRWRHHTMFRPRSAVVGNLGGPAPREGLDPTFAYDSLSLSAADALPHLVAVIWLDV